jgi:hypothetical protein
VPQPSDPISIRRLVHYTGAALFMFPAPLPYKNEDGDDRNNKEYHHQSEHDD